MPGTDDLLSLVPERVFDGGDLDCGSGLVLLLRENMQHVPEGGILELRSREPTVGDDLPPWCRMVGHAYLGCLDGAATKRYFVRRGAGDRRDDERLAQDKARARAYEWRTRVRLTGPLHSTVYCRNFAFPVGQPASFEEHDAHPSAVEHVLGALGAALASGLATECARAGIVVDDVELTVRGRLQNVLAHLGLEDGDPAFAAIDVKCFASTLGDEAAVRRAWEEAVRRSPLAATLAKAVPLDLKLAFV